jgi:hypothetical protein
MVIHLGIALLAVVLPASTAVTQEKAKSYLGASSKKLGYSPPWLATKKGSLSSRASMFNWFSRAECR